MKSDRLVVDGLVPETNAGLKLDENTFVDEERLSKYKF